VLATVPGGPALVVATPGAEPVADGGYGAALLLDSWALLGRADLRAGEETLRRWMNAATLVRSASAGGQVVVAADAAHPVVQALVRWDPWVFHRAERRRRVEAGFPPGHPVFRVHGSPRLPDELRALDPVHLLTSSLGREAVSLVTVRPGAVPDLRRRLVKLAEEGVVTRVEAEPHL
jgi:primosomal protein N' (replication factor Y)